MRFETMDWDAERKRVIEAFVVGDEAEFIEANSGSMALRFMRDYYVHRFEGKHLDVEYSPSQRSYAFAFLENDLVTKNRLTEWTRIGLDWNGAIVQHPDKWDYAEELALGLYRLNLLTPEVETSLNISAQQKAELLRIEEWCQKNRTIDWEAEAKRVALAFGIEEGTGFEGKTSDGLSLRIVRHHDGDLYNLSDPSYPYVSSLVRLNPSSILMVRSIPRHMLPMARGFYHLDLLTPAVESALGVTISAHQKMEWELELQARIQKLHDKHYSTIDWTGEAERIKRAFGICGTLEFCEHPEGMELRSVQSEKILTANGLQLNVIYTLERKGFTLTNLQLKSGMPWTNISLDWAGNVESNFGFNDAQTLIKGLYHLGLLSIEIEKALGIYVYSYQRDNWDNEVRSIPHQKI